MRGRSGKSAGSRLVRTAGAAGTLALLLLTGLVSAGAVTGSASRGPAVSPQAGGNGTAPAPQVSSPMAFDPVDGYAVLLGGSTASGPQNVTWTYANGTWTPQTAVVHTPPARGAAGFAFDPRLHALVLFGGIATNGTFLNDTWTYAHGVWTELALPVAPSPRSGPSMVWDSEDGYLLLFGGGTPGSSTLNDTWKFVHGHWVPVTPRNSPPARRAAGIADDTGDGYVVLFGGYGGPDYNDTWTYSHGHWKKVHTAIAPSIRVAPGVTYDPAAHAVILFGGRDDNALVLPNATWSFRAGNWTERSPTTVPPARYFPSFTYDPKVRGVLMFGGATWVGAFNAVNLNDTWVFHGGNWS